MHAPSDSAKVARKRTPPEVLVWLDALASDDRKEREAARFSLVSTGRPVVVPLIRTLGDKRAHVR